MRAISTKKYLITIIMTMMIVIILIVTITMVIIIIIIMLIMWLSPTPKFKGKKKKKDDNNNTTILYETAIMTSAEQSLKPKVQSEVSSKKNFRGVYIGYSSLLNLVHGTHKTVPINYICKTKK